MISIAQRLLPACELITAALLLLPATQFLGSLLALMLLSLYGAAMGINLYRGKTAIDCGCSFQYTAVSLSYWHLLRNGLFILIALVPTLPTHPRALILIDFAHCLVATVVMGLIYLMAEGLLANQTHRIMEDR